MEASMEIDEEVPIASAIGLRPILRSRPAVDKGRIMCIICFSGTLSKNSKKAGIEQIKNIDYYRDLAKEWTEYDHSFSNIYESVDWTKKSNFYAHKRCKGLFTKISFMKSQTKKSVSIFQNLDENDVPETDFDITSKEDSLRRSTRSKFSYQSNQEDLKCIICVEIKKERNGDVIPVKSMTYRQENANETCNEAEHFCEKTLKEFASIHVKKGQNSRKPVKGSS